MKLLNERDSFLSNYEVAEYMKDLKNKYNWSFTPEDDTHQDKRKFKKRFTACGVNLEVITRDVLSYMDNSATKAIESRESFESLMVFLNQFDLMKVEKLQIINSLPRSMVTLYALVEECDQRFGEEQCGSIIEKINELFPVEVEEEEEEEENEAEEVFESANGTPDVE